jgi:2-amino-4-hydroxy-6-hydroxymethyldihydropteridine diphosphokinase
MPEAYIGLGSNLDHPDQQLRRAVELLAELAETSVISTASIYQSPALSDTSHPDYLNTVARIKTSLQPLQLLDALQKIEQQRGRIRTPGRRWESRTIDLDILLYGDEAIQLPRLSVPHPEMLNRDFVMIPLLEIASSDTVIPNNGNIGLLARQWHKVFLEKVAEPIVVAQ